jgi:hypothetical protein
MFQFSITSNNRRAGVDARLIQISYQPLEISVVDFGIPKHGGMRAADELIAELQKFTWPGVT